METVPKSLLHSCRSELTRQGISLTLLLDFARTHCREVRSREWSFLPLSACRHAVRTLSSLVRSRPERCVWRRVSEDFAAMLPRRSFLLIACTPRIVTAASFSDATSSGRYSGVPANSQILLRQRSHLRTVIVTAAVYRGFGSQLRLAANRSP